MLLVFALALLVESRRARHRHRSSRNEDDVMRRFRKSMKRIADDVAREESKNFHERRSKKQTGRIFKSAMIAKMGVPWKEIIAAVPELIDKTPSMFAPDVKATEARNREQMKRWLEK